MSINQDTLFFNKFWIVENDSNQYEHVIQIHAFRKLEKQLGFRDVIINIELLDCSLVW